MTARLCLPPRISGEEAAQHFARPRFGNVYGLLAKPIRVAATGDPGSRVTPFVERLWMPAFAVRLRTMARGKNEWVWTAVDAWADDFSLFERIEQLTPCEPAEDAFPPLLDEVQAAERARKGLLQYILRRRGQTNKPVIEDVEAVQLYYYPLWVLYYRRRGRIDLKVLDGYTGKPAGAKLRAAVVAAFIEARKRRLNS